MGLGVLTVAAGCATHSRVIEPRAEKPRGCVSLLRIPHPKSFKILQFTDLHFFSGRKVGEPGGPNALTVRIMQTLVKIAKPDLLLVTGDSWPDTAGNVAYNFQKFAIEQIARLEVPWAYTWGNHDELVDFSLGDEAFRAAPFSLYAGSATQGNYAINVVDRRHRPVWQILCLNTKKEGMGAEQQQWLKSLDNDPALGGAKHPPRFAAFHIPIKQYADIWTNGAASGVMGEKVCLEKEDGSSLAILKAAGVRACICGHDHRNDYSGVIDGVELIYGRATGGGGYGAELLPKGGTLYTINCVAGTYDHVSLLPDGTRWKPAPGERKLALEKE
jgi:hypothetical protein